MACLTQQHFAAARGFEGTADYDVFYRKGEVSDLIGFTDSDYT